MLIRPSYGGSRASAHPDADPCDQLQRRCRPAYQPKGAEQRQADFINCVAWRQTAEFICRYFRKGQRIALQGSLQSRNYTDKDGNKRTAYEVVIDNAFFAESKNAGGAPAGGSRYDSQIPQYSETPPAFSTANAGDFEEIVGDDDLPF